MHDILAGQDESRALEVFRRLRSGQKAEDILQGQDRFVSYSPHISTHEQQLRQRFLVALLQSTASLWDISRMATSVLNSRTRINLPPDKACQPLKNLVITLEALGEILTEANPGSNEIEPPEVLHYIADGSHDGSLFWVPFSPWTDILDNDEAVSQLVSIFLTVVNPYWRLVEEDLFLRHMRSKDVHSLYCSKLLVNSVLACASVSDYSLLGSLELTYSSSSLKPTMPSPRLVIS